MSKTINYNNLYLKNIKKINLFKFQNLNVRQKSQ